MKKKKMSLIQNRRENVMARAINAAMAKRMKSAFVCVDEGVLLVISRLLQSAVHCELYIFEACA